jgi:hypothetical protein
VKCKFSRAHSPLKTAAAKPSHDNSDVADFNSRMRASYSVWDCSVAVPSLSEYIILSNQILGSRV